MIRLSAYIRKIVQTSVLGVAICAPSAAFAQDITTGLEAHWGFEEADGATQATDLTGNGNTLFFTSSDPDNDFVKGVFGRAVSLDSASDCLLTNINNDAIDNLDTFSLATWVKLGELPGAQRRLLSPGPTLFDLQLSPGNAFSLIVDTSNDGGSNINVTGPTLTTADLSRWHHVVGTYDGSTMSLYIDGKLANSSAQSGNVNNGGNGFGVGSEAICNQALSGLYDDTRIYNRALTAGDVQALYEAPTKSCDAQNRGSIIYNTDGQVMQYCDATNWVAMGKERYVPKAARFVRADTDWLTRGGDLTDITDTKRVTGSVWVRRTTTGAGAVDEIYSASSRFRITFDIGDNVRVTARNAADTSILSHSSAAIIDSDWHHILFSIDMENQAGSYVYVDDVDATNFFTFTDDFIDIAGGGHSIGANGGSNLFDGEMADFWLDTGTYIDLSVAANRRKFIDASGNPADLGSAGEGPLGTAPDVFMSGDIADWHTNKGTGGGFTENGEITEAFGPSKITGGVSNLSSIPACSTSTSAHSFSLAGTLPAAGRELLGLWVDPPYIFAGNGWTGGDTPFEVYTFDGTNFTVVDSVLSGHGYPENIWSDGSYYYVASPGTGLFAYTFDGTDLTLVGSETTVANEARSPWGDGTYIYVSDGTGGFHAFTFDGSTFTQVGTSVSTNGFALGVYADGEYIYLGDSGGGLRVYTFDGANWTFIDEDTTYQARRVWDDGNYLYLIGDDGLVAYNFDGTTLTALAVESTGIGGNSDVWGDGQFIYVAASGTNGVRVYDFNGTEFTLIDTYPSVTDMRSVAGDGTYIFAGDRTQGLYALNGFECLQCTNPTGRAGDMIYNTSTNQMQYCNAEQWVAMGPTGDGGVGCNNPGGAAGDITYNTTYERMQYCEGDEWIAIGDAASVAPDCPNIGDLCADGTLYGGDIDYGSGSEKIYVTDNNQSTSSIWSNLTVDTNADSQLDGQLNQSDIVTNHTLAQYPAFELCENLNQHGNTDWYLPALDELAEISSNRVAINANAAGPFIASASAAYWSSSEFDSAEAYTMGLDALNNPASDTTIEIPKTDGDSGPFGIIRCIRRD